ncbi:hypothetical protein ACH5RR_002800 [Cinchona calisaya]|uniref:Reverse transcriptase RNase H-like domain-containing protein n=1 Tax=Cinchona calisaya TaxID=153742 RepID=A0ABD3AT51_9GENT
MSKWRHYLEGHHFIIKIDHQSLKYLLEQEIATPMQQKWLTKLLEHNYEIQYKVGKQNVVADILSKRGMAEEKCKEITQIIPSYRDRVLRFKGRLYIGKLKKKSLKQCPTHSYEDTQGYRQAGAFTAFTRTKVFLESHHNGLHRRPTKVKGQGSNHDGNGKFTKAAHFRGLSYPFTAALAARVFMDNVYKLHGMP